MSLKRPLPLDFCSSEIKDPKRSLAEIEEIILPEEVLIQIWSYLDFNTVQRSCTRVSKSWLEMIRSTKLSWKMKLRSTFYYPDVFSASMEMLGPKDFNEMLLHWNSLRLLQFSSEKDFAKFHMCLNSHKSLEKIVIPNGPALYTEGSYSDCTWGWVTEYWIDPSALCTVPSHLMTRADTIKNVIRLKIDLKNLPEDLAMIQKDCDLTNLETLEINKNIIGPYENLTPKTDLLFRFYNLKKLDICLEIDIRYLLDILRFLGNTKNLKIVANLDVRSGISYEDAEEIFNEALTIVQEKFPFPDFRILDLNITEVDADGPKFKISYGESGATLTTFDEYSDLEYGFSDSSDGYGIEEHVLNWDEIGENSDSLDESVENSDSLDESVENSDTEDINVLE